MKLEVDYVDYVDAGFDKEALEVLAEMTVQQSRCGDYLVDKKILLDVAVVDAEAIRQVNKDYRGKDDVTDVISIGDYSDNHDISQVIQQEIVLGELLLCWSDIKNNATIQNTEEVYEFAYVFTHGILHLIGYQHSDEMFALQDHLSTAFCADMKAEKS